MQTYSIGLCTIEASLVKFVGSPTALIYCQLKESLNIKDLGVPGDYFTKVFSSPAVKFVILMAGAQRPSADIIGLRVRENLSDQV